MQEVPVEVIPPVINDNQSETNVTHHQLNPVVQSTTERNHQFRNEPLQNTISHVKLPPIQLPSFAGDYEQWLNFRDTFKTLVHNNTQIPAIIKFHHLRGILKGEAAAILQSIEPPDSNYYVAWDVLNERYENQGFIIDNHLKSIIDHEIILKESYPALQQFLTRITTNVRVLKSLGEPVDYWDTILIYIINTKLDSITKREWAKYKTTMFNRPTMVDMQKFLTSRCQLLESLLLMKGKSGKQITNSSSLLIQNTNADNSKSPCVMCKGSHPLFYCQEFKSLSIPERIQRVSNLKLCKNCFRNHPTKNCKSSSCRKCQKNHNTLLHLPLREELNVHSDSLHTINHQIRNEATSTSMQIPPQNQSNLDAPQINLGVTLAAINSRTQILLPSALVYAYDCKEERQVCRILLDSCSQSNYISQSLFSKLNLSSRNINIPITGINNSVSSANSLTQVTFQPLFNAYTCSVSCLVVPTITSALPEVSFNKHNRNIPNSIQLADSNFNQQQSVDALLGAEVFWQLLCIGQFSLGKGRPICQKTHFGWVVSGPIAIPSSKYG